MEVKIIKTPAGSIAVVHSQERIITDGQSALDLAMTLSYEHGSTRIAVDKEAMTEDFFILSTGFAGQILQKFVNYGIKFAVFGDYSRYTSKPLRDFIYESNRGGHVFFAASEDEAVEWLSAI